MSDTSTDEKTVKGPNKLNKDQIEMRQDTKGNWVVVQKDDHHASHGDGIGKKIFEAVFSKWGAATLLVIIVGAYLYPEKYQAFLDNLLENVLIPLGILIFIVVAFCGATALAWHYLKKAFGGGAKKPH